MPSDPSIYAQLRPVENPLVGLGQIMAIQNARQQRQINAQTIQSNQMDLQAKTQALNDQKAIRGAMLDNLGDVQTGNYANIIPAAAKNGASGKALMQLQADAPARMKAYGDAKEVDLKNQQTVADGISGAIDAIKQDPANLQQNLPLAVASLVKRGYLQPQEAAQVDLPHLTQMGNGDPVQGLNLYQALLQQRSGLIDQTLKKAETQKNLGEANKANTDADLSKAKIPGATAEAQMQQRSNIAAQLSNAPDAATYGKILGIAQQQNPDIAGAFAQAVPPNQFDPATSPAKIRQLGMTPEQQTTTGLTAAQQAETFRHNQQAEKTSRIEAGAASQNAATNAGRLAVEKATFNANYGVNGTRPLTAPGQKQMEEVSTVSKQFDDLLSKLEPYRNVNDPTKLMGPLLQYKLGIKTPEGELGNQISNLSLASIQGMMPFASKSRNYEFIKDIGQHLPNITPSKDHPLPDSPALIYDKMTSARRNFLRMEASTGTYETKNANMSGTSPTLSPENAQVYYKLAQKDPAKARQMAKDDGWAIPSQ